MIDQECTNIGSQIAGTTNFLTVAINICGSSLWKSLHVILRTPGKFQVAIFFFYLCTLGLAYNEWETI
jgi:hypothetical protein